MSTSRGEPNSNITNSLGSATGCSMKKEPPKIVPGNPLFGLNFRLAPQSWRTNDGQEPQGACRGRVETHQSVAYLVVYLTKHVHAQYLWEVIIPDHCPAPQSSSHAWEWDNCMPLHVAEGFQNTRRRATSHCSMSVSTVENWFPFRA